MLVLAQHAEGRAVDAAQLVDRQAEQESANRVELDQCLAPSKRPSQRVSKRPSGRQPLEHRQSIVVNCPRVVAEPAVGELVRPDRAEGVRQAIEEQRPGSKRAVQRVVARQGKGSNELPTNVVFARCLDQKIERERRPKSNYPNRPPIIFADKGVTHVDVKRSGRDQRCLEGAFAERVNSPDKAAAVAVR